MDEPFIGGYGAPDPLPIGTWTRWGKIVAYGITGAERYYWMSKDRGDISMIPAALVEKDGILER